MPDIVAVAPNLKPIAAQSHHVLFVFDQLRNLDGGAERSLLKITQLLPTERYHASIITFDQPADTSFFARFGCPVYVLPLTKTYNWGSIVAARKLRAFIRSQNVTIVQTFFATSDLWGATIAKLSGCPVIISSRRDMGFLRTLKHRIAYRLLAPMYDRIHTVSDAVRDFTIQQDHAAANKVITIRNGVELRQTPSAQDVASWRTRFGLDESAPLIVDVGSVKAVKGYETLAKTAEIVCKRYPKAMFVVAGAVPELEYLRQLQTLIDSLGLSKNFRFMGRVDDSFPLLQISNIFCHLSATDGLSNALLEAMMAQLPCVITRVGGNPEVVEEGRSGFVVPPGDYELAANRLLQLLADPQGARIMGERGRQIIETNLTAKTMVHDLTALYDELLESKGI